MRNIGIALMLGAVALVGCHRGASRPAASGMAPMPEFAKVDSSEFNQNAPPEVTFEREWEPAVSSEDFEGACSFAGSGPFDYDGMFAFRGRPFARANALGPVSSAQLGAREGSLWAPGEFTTEDGSISGEAYLPDVPLYASVPIVRDGWLHVLRTRIATRSSVRGPFFAPDVKLPDNVKLRVPRDENWRVPCAGFSVGRPGEETVGPFDRLTKLGLTAPDQTVSISQTPDGSAFGDVTKPSGVVVSLLGMYKTTALVALEAETKESHVAIVGWIHQGELNDDYSPGEGHLDAVGHDAPTTIACENVDVFVNVEGKLYKVADVYRHHEFRAARTESGDFRVDLGADPNWSATTPPKKRDPKAPLDPFIPKEYAPRCQDLTAAVAPAPAEKAH